MCLALKSRVYKDHAQFDLLFKSLFTNGNIIFQAMKYSYIKLNCNIEALKKSRILTP